jgi:hypothetical protein
VRRADILVRTGMRASFAPSMLSRFRRFREKVILIFSMSFSTGFLGVTGNEDWDVKVAIYEHGFSGIGY